MEHPLVSIGVPIRNGAPFVDEALDLLRQQSYKNLEIIVSDNASDDGSTEIIERHAAEDRRIRVYRQDRLITATENFRFVFEQARGEYFMWAAHDDRRSLDYVERLLAALQSCPDAALAFGDVAEVGDLSVWIAAQHIIYPFETQPDEPLSARIWRYARFNCLHIYGMIRRNALQSYAWIDIDYGPDIPLLMHLACLGEFVRAGGGCFYYFSPPKPKALEERAIANSLRPLKPAPELRLSWACAQAVQRASRIAGRPISRWQAFVIVYTHRHWGWIKPRLFTMTPGWMISLYRRWFKRRMTPA